MNTEPYVLCLLLWSYLSVIYNCCYCLKWAGFFGQCDPLWKYKRCTIVDKLHDDEHLDPKTKMATVEMPKSSKQWSCWVYTYIDRANMLMISTEYKLELRVIREDAVMKQSRKFLGRSILVLLWLLHPSFTTDLTPHCLLLLIKGPSTWKRSFV